MQCPKYKSSRNENWHAAHGLPQKHYIKSTYFLGKTKQTYSLWWEALNVQWFHFKKAFFHACQCKNRLANTILSPTLNECDSGALR